MLSNPGQPTSPAVLEVVADDLRRAEESREPIAPPSERGPFTVEDAYTVQRINLAARVARGETVVGRKIGLTSLAMQRQLGVDQPDFGSLLDTMVQANGSEVRIGELIAPRVEAEIAFRLGAHLDGTADEGDVAAAVFEVMLALEVIDSRVADWRITLPDTVADNASSARAIFGPGMPVSPELLANLPSLLVSLQVDGADVASGRGEAVLGNPLTGVVWLARALGQFGDGLRAGDVILAGAVHASVPLEPGTTVRAVSAGLPDVEVRVST